MRAAIYTSSHNQTKTVFFRQSPGWAGVEVECPDCGRVHMLDGKTMPTSFYCSNTDDTWMRNISTEGPSDTSDNGRDRDMDDEDRSYGDDISVEMDDEDE